MTPAELKMQIEGALTQGTSLLEIREYLVQYSKDGGTRDLAREILNGLREGATSDELDDRILEVLDFVEGFAHSSLRIWD